jgi:endoglucanase
MSNNKHNYFLSTVKVMSALLLYILSSALSYADIYLRYNHAGYQPQRAKQVIVMADTEQSNASWQLSIADKVVFSGLLGESLYGQSDHTAKPYNYLIDVSALTAVGTYQLMVNGTSSSPVTVDLSIQKKPYQVFSSQILKFLRNARSGSDENLVTPNGHPGDSSVAIYRPNTPITGGQWTKDPQNKKLNMVGGWYDAADYIKFTLTTAYTSYYLLKAYQEAPAFFTMTHSETNLIDVLDEARFGLDYLVKTHPENDEFVIQVSTGADHNVGHRLPVNDTREGSREALSAISPAQMALTSAALALGSRIFAEKGLTDNANKYKSSAIAIYARARASDALTSTAYEKDATNDFYLDNKSSDNMGLAALELYELTQNLEYLAQAKTYAEAAGSDYWAAWCCVTASLNYKLAPYITGSNNFAEQNFTNELSSYKNYDKAVGNIWGIPMKPYWAPLVGSGVAAAYSGLAYLQGSKAERDESEPTLLWDNIDYFFGRNNWGVSFIASKSIDNPVHNVYSQIYTLTNTYPEGAVAEGPGSTDTYNSLKNFFTATELDKEFEKFNTPQQIFFDNNTNFQTMESTIVGQATTLYMLAVASKVHTIDDGISGEVCAFPIE